MGDCNPIHVCFFWDEIVCRHYQSSQGTEYCSITGTVDVSVTFLPDYTFNSQRCIASLISIYTPFYLMVFFLRILWLPLVRGNFDFFWAPYLACVSAFGRVMYCVVLLYLVPMLILDVDCCLFGC